jgi:hypothetical protein
MKNMHKNIIYPIVLAALMFTGVEFLNAWVSPKANPPLENISAPINGSAGSQVKKGSLGLGGLAVFGSSIFTGNVKIVDGTQGPGKILTSDAEGNASWKYPSK